MAGEIQLNSTSFASESGGTITINNATLASAVSLSNHYASTSEVQGTHTTGSITSGTTSLTVGSGSGIFNGDYVVGEGITPGTTVSSGGGTTSITLSANAGATLSSDPVSFFKADKVLSPGLVAGGLCRAWVNFDGVNQTIRSSFNISSISYATGDYTVNFATAMPDANYSALITADEPPSSTNVMSVGQVVSKGFNSIRFETQASHNYANYNMSNVNVAIFR